MAGVPDFSAMSRSCSSMMARAGASPSRPPRTSLRTLRLVQRARLARSRATDESCFLGRAAGQRERPGWLSVTPHSYGGAVVNPPTQTWPGSMSTTSPGTGHEGNRNENPLLDCVIAPFCRSISGSGLHLPGIHKSAGTLEARLRLWNIPLYVCGGAARRRRSLSGESGFPAMPGQLNGYTSCPTGRGICRHRSCQL
jgi:hypothetical protein